MNKGFETAKVRINWERARYDFQYMLFNSVVNKIPSWTVRRWFYARNGMRIGDGSRIGVGTVVICPQNIQIGKRTIVNEHCVLDGRGGLMIGHDTSVSMYSKLLSASHEADSPAFRYYTKKVVLGDHVWMGTAAVVLDGSRIGNYAVIGANAVVKGRVAEKSVMVGNPAHEIRKRAIHTPYRLNYAAYFR